MTDVQAQKDCSRLLERAYRLALVMQSASHRCIALSEDGVECWTLATELVDVLDEVRASFLLSTRRSDAGPAGARAMAGEPSPPIIPTGRQP